MASKKVIQLFFHQTRSLINVLLLYRVGADQGSGRIITRLVKITIETNVLVTVINIIVSCLFLSLGSKLTSSYSL